MHIKAMDDSSIVITMTDKYNTAADVIGAYWLIVGLDADCYPANL